MKIDKKNNTEKNIESTKGVFYDTPNCDIFENDNEFIIFFDLPGVDRDNISLKVEKDILTLTGDCSKKPAEGYNCLREEMEYYGYRRSFNLNKSVDPDKIAADYDNGTLKVKLPKKEEQKTKEIKININ